MNNEILDAKVDALGKAFATIMDARDRFGVRLMDDIPDEAERTRVKAIIKEAFDVFSTGQGDSTGGEG